MEVDCCSSQDCIYRISGSAFEPIAFQSVFALQVSDAWFDCGAAFHPSPQRWRRPASSSLVDMHRDSAVVVVATVAHVHMRFAHSVADQVFNLLHLLVQRMTVIRTSSEALGADEPSAAAAYRDTDLIAELVLLASLALGDALDLRLMHRVDLVLVVPLLRVDSSPAARACANRAWHRWANGWL